MALNFTVNNYIDLIYILKLTRILLIFIVDILVPSKLTGRLPKHTVKLMLGTYYNTPMQPLVTLYIIGIILVYFTQPLINSNISTLSEIRVFLRYRSPLLNPALKSPILQVIRRTLKLVATNTAFFGKPSFFSKLSKYVGHSKMVYHYNELSSPKTKNLSHTNDSYAK